MSNKIEVNIIDSNGYTWIFNGRRVYMEKAEKEFIENNIPVEENGYPCDTLKRAVEVLKEGRYIL